MDKAQQQATIELANHAAKTADHFYDAYNAKLNSGEGTLPENHRSGAQGKTYRNGVGNLHYDTLSTTNSNLASVANNVATVTPRMVSET